MKVVLTQDYKGIGRKGETVEVKDGFALNSLFPQKRAVPVTSGMAQQLVGQKAQAAGKQAVQTELLVETIKGLDGTSFSVTRKVNEKGGLYDKIDVTEVIELIGKERGVELPEDSVEGAFPIETIGEHEVDIAHGDAKSQVTISVVAEEE